MEEQHNNIEAKSMLPVGTLLQNGKYRIERYLSSGGFGNTYVANIVEFEEEVAIKEFYMKGVNERGEDSITVTIGVKSNTEQFMGQREKFKKEARRLRKLKHEHIVTVHDLFEENGTAYYVMDLIRGESVADKMKRTGQPLVEQEVLPILSQVLDALSVVHKQGMYHLDIKPANIMLEPSGNVQLIDFGASKQIRAGEGVSLFTSSAMTYTPGYAPLEQQEQSAKNIGPWTDIYALGATLYKMLTNQMPPTASELLIASEPLSYPATVSTKIRQLIEWMMKPRFDERPQSIGEVEEFLGSAFKPVTNVTLTLVDPPVSTPVSASAASSANEETEVITPKPQPKPEPKDEETEIVKEKAKKEQKDQHTQGEFKKSTAANNSKFHLTRTLLIISVIIVLSIIAIFVYRGCSSKDVSFERTNGYESAELQSSTDLMLVIDVSSSMLAEDYSPNRIESVKKSVGNFVSTIPNSRIGVILFAGEAVEKSPLTSNYDSLRAVIQGKSIDILEGNEIHDGTAIGLGLSSALVSMEKSAASNKVIVLLTDGCNNMGDVSPMQAAEIAKEQGVRVYTISIGKNGMARYPLKNGNKVEYVNLPVEVDKETLSSIASITGGNYYPSSSSDDLNRILDEISVSLK